MNALKICVFGAASDRIDSVYIEKVEEMGLLLAQRGHSLVFGAGKNGVMGAAARGFTKGGGKITGIIPHFFKEESIEAIYDKCDEMIYTESMRERKKKMEDLAEAFIIAPGGIGTFEEFFEVLTLKQLGRHSKPLALYNIDNYYNELNNLVNHATKQGFIRENCAMLFETFSEFEPMLEYIENKSDTRFNVHDLKDG